jgi:hypothetical protein
LLFIPTAKLSKLIRNKFIDDDGIKEKNDNRQKRIMIIMTIVSIIIAAGSLVNSISVASKPKQDTSKTTLTNSSLSITLDSNTIDLLGKVLSENVKPKEIIIYANGNTK